MLYRPRPTPLHAAGPGAALAWCGALALAALLARGPLILGLVSASVLGAGLAARLGGELARALRWGLVMALGICVINALVSQEGTTIIWHFGTLPVLGPRYVSAQAVGAGALLGLRAITLILIGVLFSLGIDPDQVLVLARRFGFRSALTATLATRMVPLLMRDGRRLAEAQRTRSGPPPSRLALLGSSTSGVLDRALDVAATLEVRGFGLARPARPTDHRSRSRHDVNFSVSAGLVVLLAVLSATLAGWLALGLGPAVLAPFTDRRGITAR